MNGRVSALAAAVCVCLTTHHKDYVRWWLGLLRKVDKSLDEPHPRSVHPFTRQMALHTLHVIHGICSLSLSCYLWFHGRFNKVHMRRLWLSPWIKVLVRKLSRSFVHEISNFLWNEMYLYRFHKSLPLHAIKEYAVCVFQTFLPVDPFCLRKIITDPHILADVNTGCPDDRYPKLKIYISELIFDNYEYKQLAHWFEITDSHLLRGCRGFLN